MCKYLEQGMDGSWYYPVGKIEPTRVRKEGFCGDYDQQASCGNAASQVVSNEQIHFRASNCMARGESVPTIDGVIIAGKGHSGN